MKGRTAATHLVWSPDRFYWAVLDASGLPGRARRNGRLAYLLEDRVPGHSAEQLQTVFRRLPGDGRYLACGLPCDVARAAAAEGLTLTPESVPPFVGDDLDPGSLNLLTGRFAPASLRRLRHRWLGLVCLILVLCTALLTIGLERRAHLTERNADVLRTGSFLVLQHVLGSESVDSTSAAQPAMLRLTAERRRLEQTRDADSDVTAITNAAVLLSAVFSQWPVDVHANTESLSVTDRTVTIRAAVPSMADAQRFADAFASLPGWRLQQPRSETRRDDVAVTLRLEAER